MIGQGGSQRAKRGRPKKKPSYSREDQINELIEIVTSCFGEPYDDRDERSEDAPTIEGVSAELKINPVKVRKLLITAEYFTTEISRKVQSLKKAGLSVTQIMSETGLGQASVYSYLPYTKGVYKLKEPTLYAEQTRLFRRRKKVCENLQEHIEDCDAGQYLWEAILAFENYPFVSESGKRFKYLIDNDQICCNDLKITRKEIEDIFFKAKEIQAVTDWESKKSIKCNDLEELMAIFLRIGAC